MKQERQVEIERLGKEIEKGTRVISLSGLTSTAAKAFVLSQVQAATGKRLVIVTDSNKEAEEWACDLDFFRHSVQGPRSKVQGQNESPILVLPSFESDVYSGVSPHAETQERRVLTLWQLTRGAPEFLIVPAKSLITRTVAPAGIQNLGAVLKLDEDLPPEDLVEKLTASGYVREDPISGLGQFSLRGGIIDVWSPDAESPVRIEFFGDTVDSIRAFDAETQLSTAHLKEISVAPMRELAAVSSDFTDWAFFARERFSDENFARNLKDRTDFAGEGESFSGWEFLFPLVKPLTSTVFDYIRDAVFVIDEPPVVEQTLAAYYEGLQSRFSEITESGDIGLEPKELFLEAPELRERLERRLELRALGRGAAETGEALEFENDAENGRRGDKEKRRPFPSATRDFRPLFLFPTAEIEAEHEIQSRSTRKFHGNIAEFAAQINTEAKGQGGEERTTPAFGHPSFVRRGAQNEERTTPAFGHPSFVRRGAQNEAPLIVLQSQGMAERMEEILREYNVPAGPGSLLVGDLSAGFEIPAFDLIAYTETDIFGEVVSQESRAESKRGAKTKSKLGAFISDFRDLKSGDYVVHVDHGIGRFEALQTLESGGLTREFMLLIYADNTKLFVPVERMDLVSRYSSGEAIAPALDRLGGLGWQKTKAKAKRAMRDMADELLRLYAERKLVPGHAFSPDAPWQHEFEDAFPFDLTRDQASAIEDVKSDMETAVPMDRLVIGDVGYGKTEVAMRAAFKAVMDGKQAAILAPTTILAYQHYESFKKRFAAFPAKVELLSRFRSAKEQKSVVEAAGKSEVDILIGTHRILSQDVKLPKLGLVVVDEEQRFGVAHKEKLKQLKKKVDVLTLSATPIPRTLNMSLLGMRDLSVIETPPRDRLAINTQVVQFGEGVIKSAIELELARNGQVFFIHNRVETIESIAALVQRIVPNARIAIGHGQMNEKEMEQTMLDFIDYQYDVLVATTIIENGIDIPRANTIIINRSDNYGLSQLYQLRGRVGRSNRRAYAYLLIPSELELTPIARRRLSAIREFSDLGAGFRIAALDLELRGAGNILGGQQSGHLDALGFDLYTKMLERTIAEIRGDEIADDVSVSINLGIDVSIPKDYISEASQRLRTYKRISSVETEEALMQIHSEIQDRYGKIPGPVENLFEYGRLRKLAETVRIVSIDKTANGFAIKLSENAKVLPEKLMELLTENEGSTFSPSGILRVVTDVENILEEARQALERISSR
jgi:transcription-repair coupling factor (superfamily II helicase)